MIKILNKFAIVAISLLSCASQNKEKSNNELGHTNNDTCVYYYDTAMGIIYKYADIMPQYVGGMPAIIKHFSENFRYPDQESFQARVVLNFVVDSNGLLVNPVVNITNRVVNTPIEREIIRLVQTLPKKWIPGKCNDQNVSVQMSLPISL